MIEHNRSNIYWKKSRFVSCYISLFFILTLLMTATSVACVNASNVLAIVQNINEAKLLGMTFEQVEQTYGSVTGVATIDDVPLFSFEKTDFKFVFSEISADEAIRLYKTNQFRTGNVDLSIYTCIAVQGKTGAYGLSKRNLEQIAVNAIEKETNTNDSLDCTIYQLAGRNDSFDTVLLCKDISNVNSDDEIRLIIRNIHLWTKPTCSDPSICLYCYNHQGSCLGHKWGEWQYEKEATCINEGMKYRVCQNDNVHIETQIIPALGHKWIEENYDCPMTCQYCGQEKGQKKGYIGDLLGNFSEEKVTRGSQWTHPYVFSERIDDCMRFTMTISFNDYSGYAWDKWVLFARNEEGKWNQVGTFNVNKEALENHSPIVVNFEFEPYITFDALMWQKASNNQYTANWNVYFSEAQAFIG